MTIERDRITQERDALLEDKRRLDVLEQSIFWKDWALTINVYAATVREAADKLLSTSEATDAARETKG